MESRDTKRREEHFPTRIMCIYAVSDEQFYRKLQTHLSLWQREGVIEWLETPVGTDMEQTMHTHLKLADLVLLLISPDFFVQDLCYTAMKAALLCQTKRQVAVTPVLVRACGWKESLCGKSSALPENEQPIAEWEHQERAYENIRVGLARLIPCLFVQSITELARLFQARDLPRGYVPRPKVFDAIKSQLLSGGQMTAITTALRGAGGFGKTTLALAICHDPDIQAAFPDGILWVELGERPPRSLDVMNGVLTSLEPSRSSATTLEEARDRWRKALASRRYLLVIDDVWQAQALSPLLESGPYCVRLVTTRNDQVLPKESARLFVDVMEPEEATAILCRNLPKEIHEAPFQPTLSALASRLGYWPLLLTLANSMLVAQVRHGRALLAALAIIEQAYETRGVLAFDPGNLTDRERAVKACIEVSLRHLEEFTASHYQAVTRYQELAVFPEDMDIPLDALRRYWQGTGGLATWEVDDLCMHLHDLSLLLTCDLSTDTIRLHDVMRSYLIQCAGSSLSALHARFLAVSKQSLGISIWADLPLSAHYLWQNLVLHQCSAKHVEELQTILTDLFYLAHKVLYMGVSALEADLLQACASQQTNTVESACSLFESLYQNIVRLSHLLRQAHTLAEIGGLLLSYLGFQPPFATQWHRFECELPRPLLMAWHPFPGESSASLIRTLHSHIGPVGACAVSPDGHFIVSASCDKTLKVWDAATGLERVTLTGHTDAVFGCAVSPDGCFIVSASRDKTLKVWEATNGLERFTLIGHTDWVRDCAVSPDGNFIISASDDKTLKIWDVATGTERLSLLGHNSLVHSCAVSPDGSFIVSASEDHTLKVWDVTTGTERLSLLGHTGPVYGCAMSPDGHFIVSASRDKTLKVWDTATGSTRTTLIGHTHWIFGCAVSSDSCLIISASDDKMLKVWDAATGSECFSLQGHTQEIRGCAVSRNGRFIVSASGDHTLKMWDTTIGAERLPPPDYPGLVTCCAMSLDGSFIVSASSDKMLKMWDVATGTERVILTGHTDWVFGCAVSPDGSFIVSASSDKTLKIWDTTTGTELLTLQGHTEGVRGCAWSPDGSFIVSASGDHTLKIWDVATGSERVILTGHTDWVFGCAVSPDESFIVSASRDKTLKVWDAATGVERFSLQGHTDSVYGCVVSPDSCFIVSASFDCALKVWDAATGVERLSLQGHTASVYGCAVSPDGYFIVSASEDHTLKVWHARTGQCLLTFPVDGALYGCTFHLDGVHLVACGHQGMFFLRLVV